MVNTITRAKNRTTVAILNKFVEETKDWFSDSSQEQLANLVIHLNSVLSHNMPSRPNTAAIEYISADRKHRNLQTWKNESSETRQYYFDNYSQAKADYKQLLNTFNPSKDEISLDILEQKMHILKKM